MESSAFNSIDYNAVAESYLNKRSKYGVEELPDELDAVLYHEALTEYILKAQINRG